MNACNLRPSFRWDLSRLSRFFIIPLLTCVLISCDTSTKKNTSDVEIVADATEKEATPTIPDPRGTYSDAEGGLKYTFLSTGKFYSELLGETSFGTWSRSDLKVEVIYADGYSAMMDLGEGYLEFNGLRHTK